MKNTPKLRFNEFSGDWQERPLANFLTESKIKGDTGENSKKLTVKLWGKGIIAKKEIIQGSSETQYYIRKEGQLMYGKLDFLNCAFGIVPKELDGYQSTLDAPALDIKNANSYFLLSKITQKNFYKKYGEIADGSRKAKRVHVGTFLEMNIRIPKLEEQEKIASFFYLIDNKITLQGEKVEALKVYKKGMMQKIFSRELRFKDDEGRDYPEWKYIDLQDTLDLTIDNRGKTPPIVQEGIPLLEVNSLGSIYPDFNKINKFVDESTYNEWFRNHIKEGDLLFTTVGATGLVSLADSNKSCIAQNIVGFRFNKNYSSEFMYNLFNYRDTIKRIKAIEMGAVQPSVKVTQLTKLKFLVPSLEEQKKIGKTLSKIDIKIEREQEKLDSLNEYKKGLLQQMFV